MNQPPKKPTCPQMSGEPKAHTQPSEAMRKLLPRRRRRIIINSPAIRPAVNWSKTL